MTTTTDKTYEGHKNRTHWNVARWVNNVYRLYMRMADLSRRHSPVVAARLMQRELPPRTPDGYRYSLAALTAVMRDQRAEDVLLEARDGLLRVVQPKARVTAVDA